MRIFRRATVTVLSALLGAFVLAEPLQAQSDGWWSWVPADRAEMRSGQDRSGPAVVYRDRADRRPRTEAPRRNDRYEQSRYPQRNQRARGPAFCRNGSGHPVHGRAWCLDKGFGLGDEYRYDQRRYDSRSRIPDVIFGGRTNRGTLNQRSMEGVLGRSTVHMLANLRSDLGLRGDLNARWVPQPHGRTSVMQIRAGRTPLAELVDFDGDRRVDYIVVFH